MAKLCVTENIPIVPIHGPCALVSALSARVCLLMNLHLLDFFQNILDQEEKGSWFQQIKQRHKYFTFLLTSFLCFLNRILQFLVMQVFLRGARLRMFDCVFVAS